MSAQSSVNRVPVASITITRAEGRSHECGKTVTVTSWASAKAILFSWSMTAPRDLGYHKCDFVVTWADGETHEGRYDLKHYTCESPNLARHVAWFYSCYGLRRIPPHYDNDKDRERFIAHVHEVMSQEEIAGCLDRLDRYDLDGES
jgi:hypothetical protein